jgi:hypothetical protein
MSKFIIKRNVPLLDAHPLKGEDGKVVLDLNTNHLQAIADRANRRIRDTGDLAPIVIGHTTDDGPEEGQPEIVGWAQHFTVRRLGKTNRQAVCADFLLYRHKRGKIRKYPRRSVELWLEDMTIDPISLLGATTPDRDLGLLQLHKKSKSYSTRPLGPPLKTPIRKGKSSMQDSQGDLVQQILTALEQTDVWQWCKSQMDKPSPEEGMGSELGMEEGVEDLGNLEDDLMGEEDDLSALEDDMEDPDDVPEDLEGEGGPPVKMSANEHYSEDDDEEGGGDGVIQKKAPSACSKCGAPMKVKKSAGGPSGTNTFVPDTGNVNKTPSQGGKPGGGDKDGTAKMKTSSKTAGGSDKGKDYYSPENGGGHSHLEYPEGGEQWYRGAGKSRYSKDSARIRLARIRAQHEKLQKDVQTLKTRALVAEREKDFIQLEAEGYLLDREQELRDTLQLDDTQFKGYVLKLRKRYNKAPITGLSNMDPLRFSRTQASPNLTNKTREQSADVINYATAQGISYAQALEQMGGADAQTY